MFTPRAFNFNLASKTNNASMFKLGSAQTGPMNLSAAQMRFMGTKIFVGNLSWSASEDELKDLFGQQGPVLSVKVITDRETGRAKGFGFIEFEDEKGADSAVNNLNGKDFLGRQLRVSKANPPKPREY
eukprot:TRINITY_DN771_c0_g2_i2.p1 TRINITY_DN771_c0_g2~~TRINITY_DN771_c0_g2_i2.p1  ORF type:complete len:128 (-),score=44.86 TRINITY_DN771_c0_g2_i2:90-473(-)